MTYELINRKEILDNLINKKHGKYICKEIDGSYTACVLLDKFKETKRFRSMREASSWVTSASNKNEKG